MRLKPIHFQKSFSCDVLIFDDIGATWLENALPNSVTFGYLSTRFSYPILVNKHFLHRLLSIFLDNCFNRRTTRYYSYLDALIKSIKPKIVITAADNNLTLSAIAKRQPSILFIYVQSALRDEHSFPKGHRLPVYCSFGNIEKKIFSNLNIDYQQYLPIGSLKLDIALSKQTTVNSFQSADICFISSFRSEAQDRAEASTIDKKINDIDTILFVYAIKFASRLKLSVRVLGKAREKQWQRKELAHYKKLASGYSFEYIRTDKTTRQYASYHALFKSKLAINCGSTLGFEALSLGQKVLFGATMDMTFINDWGVRYYYIDMPQQIRLQEDSFDHFFSKVDCLRRMSLDEFRGLTENYAHQVMNTKSNLKASEVLCQKIERYFGTYSDSA